MSTIVDTLIPVGVIVFIILIVWSRVQNQSMLDTVNEIKEMFKGGTDKIKK